MRKLSSVLKLMNSSIYWLLKRCSMQLFMVLFINILIKEYLFWIFKLLGVYSSLKPTIEIFKCLLLWRGEGDGFFFSIDMDSSFFSMSLSSISSSDSTPNLSCFQTSGLDFLKWMYSLHKQWSVFHVKFSG